MCKILDPVDDDDCGNTEVFGQCDCGGRTPTHINQDRGWEADVVERAIEKSRGNNQPVDNLVRPRTER